MTASAGPLRKTDLAIVAASRAIASLSVLGFGFRAVSDDDYSRVVIAEGWALSPKLDPSGTIRVCEELDRVLADDGLLVFSLPVGKRRTMYNAHRIHPASDVPAFFPTLT